MHPRRIGVLLAMALLASCSEPWGLDDASDLALAEKRWAHLGSDDYSFTLVTGAGYEPAPPLRVIVRGGVLDTAFAIGLPGFRAGYPLSGPTIAYIFEEIHSVLDAELFPGDVRVIFDRALGYPRTITYDWDHVAGNGNEYTYTVADLVLADLR